MRELGSDGGKQLSDSVRKSIQEKQKIREYNRRKALVNSLMVQNKCDVNKACEHYSELHPYGVSESIKADLEKIKREIGGSAVREYA